MGLTSITILAHVTLLSEFQWICHQVAAGTACAGSQKREGKQSVSLASYGQADPAVFFIFRVAVKVLLTYPAVFAVEQFLKV
ncbi:MAG: hypothetical protein J5768_05405, partial [Spirochaetales bacterium]|nr:hypothetical protein [Spirochaetales bacterium]